MSAAGGLVGFVPDSRRMRRGMDAWVGQAVRAVDHPIPVPSSGPTCQHWILVLVASDKPRILQNNRDMLWSLIPLALMCILLAGVASQCTFSPGGPTAGPVPSFDLDSALRYDARDLDFPVRQPAVPQGWTPNSGSRSVVTGEYGGDASTVGFITPPGRYIQLTQSSAGETPLVSFVAGGPRSAVGAQEIAGHNWVVYGGEGVESIWVSDFEDVRILLTGSADEESFVALATAVAEAPALDR